MHPISIIIAALAVTVAAFDPDEALAHPQMKRALLEPRQTGLGGALGGLTDLSPSCTSALLGLYTSLPTPPTKLGQALRGNGGGDGGSSGGGGGGGGNPCSVNLPSSLSSDFSSYSSEVRSWFNDNSADASSVFSSCSQISRYESLLPVCVSSFIGAGGDGAAASSNSASATTTDTSSGSTSGGSGGSSSSTSGSGSESTSGSAGGSDTSGAGVSREMGEAMMALVAVGVLAAAL
ncbi:hypothetical protein N3K66_007750 [Trichothecium roseum]|uniref:Uncharacterized protein n=1 Tax=Trichothecium roseum TaxID=47278 RepID=A0ACC0UWI4_9HYPO|nr:hypothetical protein N3K66_007750 [Trichothecium roseum]